MIDLLLRELGLAVVSPGVWAAVAQALVMTGVIGGVGLWVGRRAGILADDVSIAAQIGVGLALGLAIIVPLWATFQSAGQSAFTPIAATFVIAVASTVRRRPAGADDLRATPPERRTWSVWVAGIAAGAIFIVVAGVIYSATMAPGVRDGVQPLTNMDSAFYSVLGRDLEATGVEGLQSPSGFASLPDTSPQTWYHWGEMWLAGAAIRLFGTTAIEARHVVVLPILLLAAAATTGAIAQAFRRTMSRWAFVLGVGACVALAPIPLVGEAHHASQAVGLAFGVTLYGLGAVGGALLLFMLLIARDRAATWTLALFAGGAFALLLPSHILIFLLAAGGIAVGAVLLALQAVVGKQRPVVPPVWIRAGFVAAVASGATLGWGLLTGHGRGAFGTSVGVDPFADAWQQSMLSVIVGAGALLTVPVVAWKLRRSDAYRATICASSIAVVIGGAIAWGARLSDYNTFHVFFGALAVFLTPIAAATAYWLFSHARSVERRFVAVGLVVLILAQLEFGLATTVLRLQGFGPGGNAPIPTSMLTAIRSLPSDARIAYGCRPMIELAPWEPSLVSLDAQTGRRMVPMCFEGDALGHFVGAPFDPAIEGPFFRYAPQRELYPSADARPPVEDVAAWLKGHGIDYIYQDELHTDPIVPWAIEIHRVGDHRLTKLP